jgi:hypothetical protein
MVCLVEVPKICAAICAPYLKQLQCIGMLTSGFLLLAPNTAFLVSSLMVFILQNHKKRNLVESEGYFGGMYCLQLRGDE